MTGTGNLLQRAIPRLYLAASGTVTNDSVSDVLDSAQEVTKDTANDGPLAAGTTNPPGHMQKL